MTRFRRRVMYLTSCVATLVCLVSFATINLMIEINKGENFSRIMHKKSCHVACHYVFLRSSLRPWLYWHISMTLTKWMPWNPSTDFRLLLCSDNKSSVSMRVEDTHLPNWIQSPTLQLMFCFGNHCCVTKIIYCLKCVKPFGNTSTRPLTIRPLTTHPQQLAP